MAKNYSGTYQPGQKFNAKISGLSPRTAYSLKARAVNYAGDGPDSQVFSFTTREEFVIAQIISFSLTFTSCTVIMYRL